jgi:hypothetical protein
MADRIEREIEEILNKLDNFVPERARAKYRKPTKAPGALQRWLARISMRKVMMWALVVVLIAFFMRGVPGAYLLLIGALIVFVTAFILSTRGSSSGSTSTQKRWRGQPMDLREPGWPDKIKAWLKGKKHG